MEPCLFIAPYGGSVRRKGDSRTGINDSHLVHPLSSSFPSTLLISEMAIEAGFVARYADTTLQGIALFLVAELRTFVWFRML